MEAKLVQGGVKKYECVNCDKTFIDPDLLISHTQEAHIKYVCEYCDISFKKKDLLIKHKSISHKYEKRFKCEHCDKAYSKLDHYEEYSHGFLRIYFYCLPC